MDDAPEGLSTSERRDQLVGIWEVEGDQYEVVRSPEGGLLATGHNGTMPINPMWVMLRGVRVSAPPLPPPHRIGLPPGIDE